MLPSAEGRKNRVWKVKQDSATLQAKGAWAPRLQSGFWKLLPSLCFRASASDEHDEDSLLGGVGAGLTQEGDGAPSRAPGPVLTKGRPRYQGPLPNR